MIISVIVPAYNQHALLRECVLSVLNCDYRRADFEVIIVNDASSDDTPQTMAELKQISPDNVVTIHHEQNRNAAAARNTGVLNARNDVQVLAFIDQDCVVPRDWLKRISDVFEKDRDLGFVGGQVLCNPKNLLQEWALHMSHRICDYEDYQTRVIGTNMAFAAHVFHDNFFDEDVGYGTDETEFVFRLTIKGYHLLVSPDLVVYHYHRDNFVDLMRQRWAYAIGEARFYRKYGFSIYHPVNLYMLKTNIVMLLFFGAIGFGYVWFGLVFGLLWLRYLVKYARIRYESFLKDRDLSIGKMMVFISLNWLVDNVVLLSKLKVGNPI